MDIWLFSSASIKNIEIGFRHRLWAVSRLDVPYLKGRFTKSRRMLPGTYGVLYCSEDQDFTVPFVTLTQPEWRTVENVWDQSWALPFRFRPLGDPSRRVHLQAAKRIWEKLRGSRNPTWKLNGMSGLTAFVRTRIKKEDWDRILEDLGRSEVDSPTLDDKVSTIEGNLRFGLLTGEPPGRRNHIDYLEGLDL